MYEIKSDRLGFIGSKEDCMQKIKGFNQEIRKIEVFKGNYDRPTDWPTNRQTYMRAHREFTLPIMMNKTYWLHRVDKYLEKKIKHEWEVKGEEETGDWGI